MFDGVDVALDGDVENVTIKRASAPTFTKGIATPGSVTSISALANVQPVGQVEAQELDKEYTRDKIYKRFFTKTALQADDLIEYGSNSFGLLSVANWLQHGGFCEATGVAVNSKL